MSRTSKTASTPPGAGASRVPLQLKMNFSGENPLAEALKTGKFILLVEQNAPGLTQPLDAAMALAAGIARRLADLPQVSGLVAKLPLERRVLVTGHESLGYFAARYGFKLVGAVLPSLSSQAETSASELAALKALITANRVPAIFTEVGTSPKVALSLAGDAKVKAVPLAMHSLPHSGGYEDYLRTLARTITGALEP